MKTKYEKTLNKLAAALKRKPMTAKAVADKFGCSKPTAHQRLRALAARGEAVYSCTVREGASGPLSEAFGIRTQPGIR